MISTPNPWLELSPSGPPYVLETDREYVYGRNAGRPEHQLMVNAIPEPFIRNPETAKVVLLNLNPGYDETVKRNHSRPVIKEAIFRNLHHESCAYPFYAFDPDFKETGVGKYWRKYTKRLQGEAGLDDREFSQRLLVIEWFPYASRCGGLPMRPGCQSQRYSFHLAKEILAKPRVQVVGTRSNGRWLSASSEFGRVPFLRNARQPWITRGNMGPGVFDRLVTALTEGAHRA